MDAGGWRWGGTDRACGCCGSLLGNVGLFKKKVKVEWLKPELKEQLQACGEKPPPGSVQCLGSPERVLPSSELHGALGRLGALCRRLHLGTPRFLTRCVQAEPDGWQRYWGQVVIPSYPVPCSTFLWVREDAPGTVGHEKMKEAMAQLALMMLGESLPTSHHNLGAFLGLLGAGGRERTTWHTALSSLLQGTEGACGHTLCPSYEMNPSHLMSRRGAELSPAGPRSCSALF